MCTDCRRHCWQRAAPFGGEDRDAIRGEPSVKRFSIGRARTPQLSGLSWPSCPWVDPCTLRSRSPPARSLPALILIRTLIVDPANPCPRPWYPPVHRRLRVPRKSACLSTNPRHALLWHRNEDGALCLVQSWISLPPRRTEDTVLWV